MFLPAASLLGPPFSSHPPQTFLHPWGVSAEPVNHKFIFCTAQRAAAPRMPALHLAWLRQAVAGEPEIPPACTLTLPPPTRAWGLVGPPVVRVKAGADWSRCGECSSCSSISLPPCRVIPRPSWIRVPPQTLRLAEIWDTQNRARLCALLQAPPNCAATKGSDS